MKLNEVLDVFGNESLETVMTPEQEFEASVESLIEEIDNVMDIRAGLESMEEGAVELAKVSCESLLTGLAVREMSIANEDADLAYICNAFNVKPELFGLEANEATMKEQIKDKAGKAGAAIKNSRVAKAAAAIYAKIVAFIKSFFSFDNIVVRMIKKLSEKAKGLLKKGTTEGEEVTDSVTIEILDKYDNAIGTVKDGVKTKKFQTVIDKLTEATAKIKGMDFKKPFVSAGEFLKKVAGFKHASGEKVSEAEVKEAVKYVEPGLAKKFLQALQGYMVAIKNAFKKAISIDLKSLFKIGKGKEAKPAAAAESVEFGIEALDSLFGEIKRVEAGVEEVEVPEEYAEIGVEGMEVFEEFDAFESTMEAVESVEEMYIEATIPSQIAALESIAIEKGLNPDNGVSFDLLGTMSAGIEATNEVVEKASEETKKTMKERVKGAASKAAQMVKSAFSFVKAKLVGIGSIKKALKAIAAGVKNMSEEEAKKFFEENSAACNRIFVCVQYLKALATPFSDLGSLFTSAKTDGKSKEEIEALRKEMSEAMKTGNHKSETLNYIDDVFADAAIGIMSKFEKGSKWINGSSKVIRGFWKAEGGLILAPIVQLIKLVKAVGKDLGKLTTAALNGAKTLLAKLGKKKAEAPVEQPAEA